MTDVLPMPGFHYGVPYEDYARWDAINFSRLKPIRDTCSKCKYAIDHPQKPTAAMILGSALHVAVLEPARFEGMFYICPPCNRTTTKGKEIWEQAVKEANGREILRQGDDKDKSAINQLAKLRGMAKAVRDSKEAAPFLNAPGQNEVSMLWQDDDTGLMCKARMDRFSFDFAPLDNSPLIVEIKSAEDASPFAFGKILHSYGYAAQGAGSYRVGVRKITGKTAFHIFIVVENEPPHDLAVYAMDNITLQTGERHYQQMLRRYSKCVKTGKWPGYPPGIKPISMPEYSHAINYE